ncbi:MAG: septal ring lytic transglycosylase RlpA family protein [Bacteroidota bacterium]
MKILRLALALWLVCTTFVIATPYRLGGKEFGQASYYGQKFHGRLTASGEKFNMYAMTAAHKHLPFGSLVRITNKANGKQVVLRINDRGPFKKGRIIDVSYKAAEELDLIQAGVTDVEMLVLRLSAIGKMYKEPKPKIKSRPVVVPPEVVVKEEKVKELPDKKGKKKILVFDPSGGKASPRGYTVQTSAYRDLEEAKAEARLLKNMGFHDTYLEAKRLGKRQYLIRVLVGQADKRAAERIRKKLQKRGFPDSFVRPHDVQRKHLKAKL